MKKSTCYGILWGCLAVCLLWAVGQQAKVVGESDLWVCVKMLWSHVWNFKATYHPEVVFSAVLAAAAVKGLDLVVKWISK